MTGRLVASLTTHRVRQLGRYRLKTLWPMQPSCITLKLRAFITITWADILDKVSKHYQLFVNVFLPSCLLCNFFHFLSKRLYLLQLLLSFRLERKNTLELRMILPHMVGGPQIPQTYIAPFYEHWATSVLCTAFSKVPCVSHRLTTLLALSCFSSLYCSIKGALCFSHCCAKLTSRCALASTTLWMIKTKFVKWEF